LQYIGGLMQYLPLAKLTPPLGDFDDNYTVNAADLAAWKASFGASATADSDNDGDADGTDFLAWQRTLGSTVGATPTTAAIPEPTSLLLALFASYSLHGTRISRKTRPRLVISERLT
jgi:hypothetical protein